MFPARNRLIAALASLTVVVEARSGSGALLTAQQAHAMAKPVGAVPGRVTSPLARGPHQLLRDGARLITGPQDVLDILFGPGNRPVRCESTDAALTTPERALLTALAEGDDAQTAAFRAGLGPLEAFEALAGLEMAGRLKRGMGGRYLVSL
jgi:DNA processing protein